MALTFPEGTQNFPCKVLQIQSHNPTTAFAQTATATSTVISGFSKSITKVSSTSHVLIVAMLNYCYTGSYARFNIQLTRGGTPIAVGTSTGNRLASTLAPSVNGVIGYGPLNHSVVYKDNPGSGTHTYDFRVYDLHGGTEQTLYFNRGGNDSNNDSYHRTASVIQLIEIEP